jgi:hypothetical protein
MDNSPMLSKYRMIMVNDVKEAKFTQQFINNEVAVAFNDEYCAFAIDTDTVFVYIIDTTLDYILAIFNDSNIVKYFSKPFGAIKLFTDGKYQNCLHISRYLSNKGNRRDIPKMKMEIMDQDKGNALNVFAADVAIVTFKYKLETDEIVKNQKKRSKILFNKKRDCYLLYLTAYNDILSRTGPMKFTDLTIKVRDYPYLCKTKLHPAMALEGLIKVGSLNSDTITALVSLPDQN